MRRFDRVLLVSPHADDEVLGCGGLLARLADDGCDVHVLYLAVDGMSHYGLAGPTTFPQRTAEIEKVSELLGFGYEIAYGDRQLTERLDTVGLRELVDLLQERMDRLRPDLLLLPSGDDYDQDHAATFRAGFAAARPIGGQFGKWLVPHVMAYEMTICPLLQSMSPSCMAATSQTRSPSRDSAVKIAKSRRPRAVSRSQLASSRSACPGCNRPGRELSLRLATVGTAVARSRLIRPVTNKKRSSDRNAVTMLLASGTLRSPAWSSTNWETWAADSRSSPPSNGLDSSVRKVRTAIR
ncbi:PIG-L deacetylase family protein [Nonomuraea sp. NPDC050022]|uniref:PIG-L deacetylase family protein n=1 Tax=unclassified Nonomuraea TaxID=2593643 RepID=UPI00340FBD23